MASPPPPPSLAQLAIDWLDWKNTSKPSAATMRARQADLVAIGQLITEPLPGGQRTDDRDEQRERWLGQIQPTDLTRETVTTAFARYARTHAPSSIRRCRSTWSGFCKWLVVHRELLPGNPVEFVEPPTAKRWQPKPISEEDLARIISAAQQPAQKARDPWPELEQALCALFVGAGLRVSEAVALRVGDVHRSPTELAKLHVTGKGGTTRTIPVPPEVVAVVDTYLESRTERFEHFKTTDPLLIRPSGQPLTASAIDHLVTGWFRRAGVAPPKGALAHSLRHTYATLLVEQAGSVPEVQRLLGHANLATTQAYIDVAAKGIEETAMANPARRLLPVPHQIDD